MMATETEEEETTEIATLEENDATVEMQESGIAEEKEIMTDQEVVKEEEIDLVIAKIGMLGVEVVMMDEIIEESEKHKVSNQF